MAFQRRCLKGDSTGPCLEKHTGGTKEVAEQRGRDEGMPPPVWWLAVGAGHTHYPRPGDNSVKNRVGYSLEF